jgi:hypothetical protein
MVFAGSGEQWNDWAARRRVLHSHALELWLLIRSVDVADRDSACELSFRRAGWPALATFERAHPLRYPPSLRET